MPYLIDGHNLIPRIPGIHLHDIDDEIHLIKLLQDFCRETKSKAEIFFDNSPPGSARTQKHGRVTAHFIRFGSTADNAIRTRLRKIGRAAPNWTVVTSDREIIAACREVGAKTLSAAAFASQVLSTKQVQQLSPEMDENIRLSPEAIDEWLDIFGEGKEET